MSLNSSLLITANQPFGEWNKVLPDETTAVAAVDRLVHHGTILEMNVESYRRRSALDRSAKPPGPGRPPGAGRKYKRCCGAH